VNRAAIRARLRVRRLHRALYNRHPDGARRTCTAGEGGLNSEFATRRCRLLAKQIGVTPVAVASNPNPPRAGAACSRRRPGVAPVPVAPPESSPSIGVVTAPDLNYALPRTMRRRSVRTESKHGARFDDNRRRCGGRAAQPSTARNAIAMWRVSEAPGLMTVRRDVRRASRTHFVPVSHIA
jgi:hypothetical protein